MKRILSFALIFVTAAMLCLVGCDTTTGGGKVATNEEELSAITNTCKLTKSYEGKDFITDGIGEASVVKFTDGDTFTARLLKDNTTVTIRFHSIDTPESTGGIEKWGVAASNFVKKRLNVAGIQIVLEATSVPAEHDSYGSRYLGYVWYRTSETEDFKNLNLELVENGFSENKGVNTSKFPYNSYFEKAEENARSIQLRLFSKLEDPLFKTDPEDVSVKALREDEALVDDDERVYWNDENNSGSKVRFYAYLESLTISNTGTYTFNAVTYDSETGESYSIPVYAAYSSSQASRMPLGHLYRVVGSVQKYNGRYQISGITFSLRYDQPSYTKIAQRDYYMTFNSSVAYQDNYEDTLYSDVTIANVSLESGVMTIEGTTYQRTSSGNTEQSSTYTFKVKVAEGTDVSKYSVGKTFSVKGYQFVENSKIIDILKLSDIVLK